MSFKTIVAASEKDIAKPFKSVKQVAVEKIAAAKKALEELALHVDSFGVIVAEDTEAAVELAVSALKREQATLEAKIAPQPAEAPAPAPAAEGMAGSAPQAQP